MIYATTADLESYLGTQAYERLCDRDDSGAVDTSDVEDGLSRASSYADSYIAKWIPAIIAAATVPRMLVQHVLDLAVYFIAGNDATEDMRTRYEDALRWLRDVQSGRATLDVPPVGEGESASYAPSFCSNRRELTRRTLRAIL